MKRKCPICGRIYHANPQRLKHGRETTCSRTCSYILRANKLKVNRQAFRCPICNKEFTRSPAEIKAKHGISYCSRICHYQGRSKGLTARIVTKPYVRTAHIRARAIRKPRSNYRHSEKTKARLREATTSAIAAGKISPISKCEDKVAGVLSALEITFKRQIAIRDPVTGRFGACVDFLLADGRILEVNGTFWHADPRFYPSGPRFKSQRRTATRWDRKTALLKRLGIPLLVVWEADIRKNARHAVQVALAGGG